MPYTDIRETVVIKTMQHFTALIFSTPFTVIRSSLNKSSRIPFSIVFLMTNYIFEKIYSSNMTQIPTNNPHQMRKLKN